jgi:hypothetical protein
MMWFVNAAVVCWWFGGDVVMLGLVVQLLLLECV